MRRLLSSVAVLALAMLIPFAPVQAAGLSTPKNKGLYITPIRQYITQDAGTAKTASITVGNYTDDPMVINFSVKAFSVSDYSYDFKFSDAPADRVRFGIDKLRLNPNDSKTITYRVDIPAGTRPGGQYYTLFATGSGESGTSPQQIQATSLVYLTVNGTLSHDSGLPASSIDHLVFKSKIPFSLDISNSGNVHYFTFITARLKGWIGSDRASNETHLLLPGTTRHFNSNVPAPFWPGLYRVEYGYRTDFQPVVTRVSRIVYIPPWSVAAAVAITWTIWIIVQRRKKHQGAVAATDKTDTTD